jgi:uncharacterized membrane protein
LKAARLPEPVSAADAQRVLDLFHGVDSAARRLKDAATALRQIGACMRTALRRGASPHDVRTTVDHALAGLSVPAMSVARGAERVGNVPATASENVSTIETHCARPARRVTTTRAQFGGFGVAAVSAAAALLSVWNGPLLAQPLPCRYEVAAVIQAPPGPVTASPTFGNAISPNGRYVVGTYNFDAVGADKAYYYDMHTRQFTILPALPNTFRSMAFDVSDAGQIVGMIAIPTGDKGFIFSINSGQYTLLEPIHPEGVCEVTGITSKGVVCGTRSVGSKGDPVFPKTAFNWHPARGFTDLGLIDGFGNTAVDINEREQVSVSTGVLSPGFFARIWTTTQLTNVGPVPRGVSSDASHLNNAGQMLVGGIVQQSPFVTGLFVYDLGSATFTQLPRLPFALNSAARAIADDGTVAGHCNYSGPGSPQRACLWLNRHPVDVNTLLPPGTTTVRRAKGLSASKTMVCDSSVQASPAVVVLVPDWPISGDADCNDRVNVDDLITVILTWGDCGACHADVTSDGIVDVADLVEVLLNWGHYQ